MKTMSAVLALVGIGFAGTGLGTKPRPSPSEYKAQESRDGITIAAEAVPPDQVKNIFATDLSKGYVVVEVAAYPSGKTIDLSRADFLLRCGSNQMVRAASPQAVPRIIQDRNNSHASDIDIIPIVGIGYESGPYGRGVTTNAGVVVAAGGNPGMPPPASTDRDRGVMQYELEDKGLPEGPSATPVSGYLYFPFPANKQKKFGYELEYTGPGGVFRLVLK